MHPWEVGILVLMTTSWPRIREKIMDVVKAIETLPVGGYVEVVI